ncbi:flavodoxin domain-containing protein [Leucobacter massiliensis]|uniref:flavodoxin domain-containing protein n=1 Tax=Leucobacter massiliensis TaxID=1686285 RepID=UPI001FE85C3E|nr:flavodoxin domain-containing protein [Leucobacter massiliensis]
MGSGPAGCFTAQALRRTFPGAAIDVFDELPTPSGLVRYGVAADHQGTKAVGRQFDRLFAEEGVRFRGNCRLGVDFALEELERGYDVVVLASGVHRDARLGIPGADLAGVRGAGAVTRFLNAHPDEATPAPLGERVAIVGHGNVAMDLARLIARGALAAAAQDGAGAGGAGAGTGGGLDGSDIDDSAHRALTGAVRTVHLLGRSAPAQAKFDPVMVRELASLPGVRHVLHGAGELPDDGRDARIDAVRALAEGGDADGPVTVEWWFGVSPSRFEGEAAVAGVVLDSAAGEVRIPADDVITAVGFTADAGSPVEPAAHPDGRVRAGLYTAGWLRRGPRGTIPDQRADARELARLIAADVHAGAVGTRVTGSAASGEGGSGAAVTGLPPIDGETGFEGWRRIDLRERLTAAPGRSRAKLRGREALLAAARDETLELPPLAETAALIGAGVPTTILFGTESGGAELVAEELARACGDGADVEVRDLAQTSAAGLDPARLHLVVCATYGDGEVPSAAEPFHRELRDERPELTGVRYAVFGMGDRSYERTYSRGSELIDEALQACGAVRVGEYGRHDAGGSIPVSEAAREWAAGVYAELAAVPVRG